MIMSSQNFRQLALRKLENGSARLNKLIKLGAPCIIICNEVRMLQKTIALLEDEFIEGYRKDAVSKIGEAKNTYGFCCKQGCNNEYVEDNDKSFGEYMCAEHSQEDMELLQSYELD